MTGETTAAVERGEGRHKSREQWRPIAGTDDRYEISTYGRVRSLWFRNKVANFRLQTPRMLKQAAEADGYRRVTIKINGRAKFVFVHRIMLETFVGLPPTPEYETGYRDGNPAHNIIGNLKWVTGLENAGMWQRHGRTARGETHGFSKLTAEDVRTIRYRLNNGAPQRRVAAEFNIAQATVWRIKRYVVWAHV